ncbi:MAG TPA: hypothetical protein VG273_28315 [Bryobacteraceae bacterium]|jgi:hypothetical protein|nr:hypothetical protein [Bryobacteraceae bacterium]
MKYILRFFRADKTSQTGTARIPLSSRDIRNGNSKDVLIEPGDVLTIPEFIKRRRNIHLHRPLIRPRSRQKIPLLGIRQRLALEMRLFTRGDLKARLLAAGFQSLEFDNRESPELGIVFPIPRAIRLSRAGKAQRSGRGDDQKMR